MCDEIGKPSWACRGYFTHDLLYLAGTMRQAEIQPTLPKFLFSSSKGAPEYILGTRNCPPPKSLMKPDAASPPAPQQEDLDEFSDDPLNYSDFIPEGTKSPILKIKMPANWSKTLMISSKAETKARRRQRQQRQLHFLYLPKWRRQ